MTDHHRDKLRMEALLDALADDPDPVGEGRRLLLDHVNREVRSAIHDEPDPMLEEIERHDEWLEREGKDVWNL